MKSSAVRGLGLGLLVWVGTAAAATAEPRCEADPARDEAASGQRHFMVLGARKDVFYDTSGPSFVILMKADMQAGETTTGAVGIYPDEDGRVAFGAVPPRVYDAFLTEPDESGNEVMLRLEITPPQYERALGILADWDRRARERTLLYHDDILLNHILYLKQVTEALNACEQAFDLYTLDWGIDDYISSEETITGMIPYLFFEELKERNASLHVPDSRMPSAVMQLAGASTATKAP